MLTDGRPSSALGRGFEQAVVDAATRAATPRARIRLDAMFDLPPESSQSGLVSSTSQGREYPKGIV
jgi:hypothetical protein